MVSGWEVNLNKARDGSPEVLFIIQMQRQHIRRKRQHALITQRGKARLPLARMIQLLQLGCGLQ